jgi:biotin carboxyl carrier protein
VRYYVSFSEGEPPIEVDVTERPSGELDVRQGGSKVDVDVVRVGAALSMRVDGRLVDLTFEGTPPDLGMVGSGMRSYVRVESERMRAAAHAKKGGSGGSEKTIKSPMPGRVVKVLVKAGDEIAAGQALLVVEAMKMENEIRAKAAGSVAEVHVAAGATVESNAKLITLA